MPKISKEALNAWQAGKLGPISEVHVSTIEQKYADLLRKEAQTVEAEEAVLTGEREKPTLLDGIDPEDIRVFSTLLDVKTKKKIKEPKQPTTSTKFTPPARRVLSTLLGGQEEQLG